jgi:iron(III) transport system substrate-binding protein
MAAKEFTLKTGITVNQTRKATGEALAQLRAEAANPKTDIWWGGTGDPFLQAAEVGLLAPYRPDYLNDLHGWSVRQYAMTQNMVGGFYTSAIGFGWNTELLKKKKLPEPKCWADMIKPIYKGEVEISHPASSGTVKRVSASSMDCFRRAAALPVGAASATRRGLRPWCSASSSASVRPTIPSPRIQTSKSLLMPYFRRQCKIPT